MEPNRLDLILLLRRVADLYGALQHHLPASPCKCLAHASLRYQEKPNAAVASESVLNSFHWNSKPNRKQQCAHVKPHQFPFKFLGRGSCRLPPYAPCGSRIAQEDGIFSSQESAWIHPLAQPIALSSRRLPSKPRSPILASGCSNTPYKQPLALTGARLACFHSVSEMRSPICRFAMLPLVS